LKVYLRPADARVRAVFALVALLLLAFLVKRGAFDFDCYWVGSWAVRDGKAPQMYAVLDTPNAQGYYDLANDSPAWSALAAAHLGKSHQLWGFIYPPPAAVMFLPFTSLSRTAAMVGWRLVNLAAYLAGVALLLALLRDRLRPMEAQILLLAALASPPLLMALAIGQMTPLVFFTIAAGLYFLRTERPVAAGACLALGTLLKVSPVLFAVWLLWRKQYRALAAGAATLIGLSLVSMAITGAEVWRGFLGHCLPLLSRGTISDTNVSALALVGRALGLGDPHSAWILPQDARLTLFKLAFYAVVLLVSAVALWQGRRDATGERLEGEYALVNMAALLLSPITWGHHLLLAVLTLLYVAAWGIAQKHTGPIVTALLAYLLMLQHHDFWHLLPGGLGPVLLPVGLGTVAALLGLLLLWAVNCACLLRAEASERVLPVPAEGLSR